MPIEEHFLYSRIIEGDGRIRREPTVAGCALMVAVALALGYIVLVLFAVL